VATSVFNFKDYKDFVRDRIIADSPKKRGQYRAMAKHLRVHASLLSHVFRGPKDLTPEQACSLAEFFALGELETDYLVAMVERARAGSVNLARSLERRLKMLRERHLQIEHRLPASKALTPQQQATFYSQWYFSAIRLAAGLDGMATPEAIAARLNLPTDAVERALEFLLSTRLVIRRDGGFSIATKRTHLSATSPLVAVHHRNWRTKAMALYDRQKPSDFVFTAAIALAKEDLGKVRELLTQSVANLAKIVEPSKSETLAMFNIDFLEL
jgi:uncharacterized protein (TIGR02147 family)